MYKVLIIGDGRVATHFRHFFTHKNYVCTQWSRRHAENTPDLKQLFTEAERALLLISDMAIPTFLDEHPFLKIEKLIHCSGAMSLPEIESAHPLMTFSRDLYPIEAYDKIPFITELGRRPLNELLPGLENPRFAIPAEKKALYHALCAMSGNFTTILWEQAFARFETDLGLPRETLRPYMEQVCANLGVGSGDSALTGPLARGDVKTIVRHLDALAESPEQNLYYAFVNYYLKTKNKIGELEYEHIRL